MMIEECTQIMNSTAIDDVVFIDPETVSPRRTTFWQRMRTVFAIGVVIGFAESVTQGILALFFC